MDLLAHALSSVVTFHMAAGPGGPCPGITVARLEKRRIHLCDTHKLRDVALTLLGGQREV